MNNNKKIFIVSAALAACLIITAPAFAETANNLTLAQPVQSQFSVQNEPQEPPVAAPETNQPQEEHLQAPATTTPHHATTTHHTTKKKTAHKPVAAKKHKKKVTKKHMHKKTTTSPAQQPHASNAHKAPKHVIAKTEKHPAQHKPDVSTATLPPVTKQAATPVRATPAVMMSSKAVTYDFCIGSGPCVPTRYESAANGKPARAQQQDKQGNWAEAKLDPCVMTDLNKMASAEPGNRIERNLTPDEKETLADHQGKMHATLVSAVNSGNKEEAKTTMRELHIQNMNDLNAYDARLCNRETATQAVGELSTGR